jgi:hypothetical protein
LTDFKRSFPQSHLALAIPFLLVQPPGLLLLLAPLVLDLIVVLHNLLNLPDLAAPKFDLGLGLGFFLYVFGIVGKLGVGVGVRVG